MITERLAWTLVHSMWQAALVAVMVGLILRSLPRRAETRYAVAAGAMLVMLAAPAMTFIFHHQAAAAFRAMLRFSFWPLVSPEALQPVSGLPQLLASWTGWIVPIWLAGVTVFAARLAAGWQMTRTIARAAVESEFAELARLFSAVLGQLAPVRRARLLLSDRIDTPAAVGWWRPIVLLPVSLATGLDSDLLRAVFAHELAHIRRHDFAVNILQNCVESLLFYHPAMWWLSRRVRIEREHCCDDVAARVCGDTAVYARALVALERARETAPSVAMAVGRDRLRARVLRLSGRRFEDRSWGEALGLATVILAAAIGGTWKPAPIQAQAIESATSASTRTSAIAVQVPTLAPEPKGPVQLLLSTAVALAQDPVRPSASSASQTQATEGIPRGGIIAGRILHPDGTPAIGVYVAAFPVDPNQPPCPWSECAVPRTFTKFLQADGSGRYRMEEVPAGQYYLQASEQASVPGAWVAGYGLRLATYFPGGTTVQAEAKTVRINSAETVELEFRLWEPIVPDPSLPLVFVNDGSTFRVKGKIANLPVPTEPEMVKVRLMEAAGGTRPGACLSGASARNSRWISNVAPDGAFEIRGVIPGEYIACAIASARSGGYTVGEPRMVTVVDKDVGSVDLDGRIRKFGVRY